MMVWAFGIFGIYFFTSLYLQGVLGFSPTKAGLAFLPMALFLAVFAGLSGPVAARVGTHRTVALGLVLNAVGLYLFWRLGAGRQLRRADAGVPAVRRGLRADERAADQRGAGGHAAGALRDGLRPAQQLA